ncbi:tripartite tricarboxylate transporter substrate binding protein [Ramlibacter solisilvae]|uniref:Candidate extracytoplasmic binding receptor n=1 Tax=Ramlibacter tataouinensis TaxID=94132 RepID=A0A127JV41_9BURK|nr:hypothetical protein UC35_14430 [Ramlibacter tataouinensis]
MAPIAQAEDIQPIKLVVPVPPGATLDTTARRIAKEWAVIAGAPVVVENRPGANTLIGADFVARAAADGRTLLYSTTSMAIAPLLQKTSLSVDGVVPVIQISAETYALAVSTSSTVTIPQDLERLAAARREGLNCSVVPGAPELACEQLKILLKGRSTSVPYAGAAPAVQAVVAGEADLTFAPVSSLLPLVHAGRLRLVAVSSRDVLPPDMGSLPLLSMAWRGFFLEGFTGIFAPKGTPKERMEQLNRELNAVLRAAEVRESMRISAQIPVGGGPEHLDSEMRRMHTRYREIIKLMGVDVTSR